MNNAIQPQRSIFNSPLTSLSFVFFLFFLENPFEAGSNRRAASANLLDWVAPSVCGRLVGLAIGDVSRIGSNTSPLDLQPLLRSFNVRTSASAQTHGRE